MITPGLAVAFWLVVWLVATQYRRVAANEQRLYGTVKNPVGRQLSAAILYGLGGGVFASLLLVFVGVSLSGSGVFNLLPLAVLLYLVSPRLMCFSYAGGIVCLAHLLLGWPRVNVAAIMGLVAILHITESVLIRLSGASCTTPVFVRNDRQEVVGGYGLYRFWPVPLVVLFLVAVPDPSRLGDLIEMPNWWPLIGSIAPELRPGQALVYTLAPVVAALGYSDLAVSSSPREKSRATAGYLAAYSLVLLVLAVLAARQYLFQWVATLFGPLGHEAVIAISSRGELGGRPRLARAPDGVRVLDVLPGGPAQRAGLQAGDVILGANGSLTASRDELKSLLTELDQLVLTVERNGETRSIRVDPLSGNIGLITVPEPGDDPNVDLHRAGRLVTWLRRHRSR